MVKQCRCSILGLANAAGNRAITSALLLTPSSLGDQPLMLILPPHHALRYGGDLRQARVAVLTLSRILHRERAQTMTEIERNQQWRVS